MKKNIFIAVLLISSLLLSPLSAFADIIPDDPVLPTFENEQGLNIDLQISGAPLINGATSSIPVAAPIEIAYAITLGTKNYPNQTEAERLEILTSILEDNKAYLELWSGQPFTNTAAVIDTKEISAVANGQVTMTLPSGGSHFFILYVGDQIRDREAYCEKYEVAPVDCADPSFFEEHSPEEVHPYFTYELGSNVWEEFQFAPLWGGVRFNVGGPVEGASNILFIPGFTASRLYTKEADGDERRLWEPNGSNDVKDLALNADGTSPYVIYTRDIVDSVLNLPFGFTVHEEFMEYLDELKSSNKITDWKGYPYDWRYDVFDVVDDGALKEDGSREYLISVVEQLAATSKNGKVAIVGHSNGGLVAKALMVRLAEQGKEHLIDKVVLIAAPQAGTPKGMFSMLHGREKLLNFIIPAGILRNTLATLPGAYALTPSAAYFGADTETLAEFVAGEKTSNFVSVYDTTLDSSEETKSFALNTPETRPAPGEKEVGTPLPLPSSLIAKMEQTHAVLDAWIPPAGVEVHEIAGWGQPTVRGSSYYTATEPCLIISLFCTRQVIEYRPLISNDGDDTVMSRSALLQGRGVYLDLEKLNNEFKDNRKHHNITESEFLHPYLSNLLTGSVDYEERIFSIGKPVIASANTVVGVHSPAVIHATDSDGRVTGIYQHPTSDLMYVREEIPGSSVELGGEGKYLVLPEDGDYNLNVQGTGPGTFGLTFANEDGDVYKEFKDLPISTSTKATVTLNDKSVGQLSLDLDGDGKIEGKITDKLTRKDAISICKKEIGLVRTIFVKIYLLLVLTNIESQGKDSARFQKFVNELKTYVQAKMSSIPPERALAIATCIRALENSKK